MALNVRQHMLIRFAEKTWKFPGAREAAIWDTFGVSPVRYSQELGALLERAEAEVAYPGTVRRLRRLRDGRRAQRSVQRVG